MWMCVDGEVCVCLLLCAGTGSGMTMSYVNSWHAHVHLWCVPEGAGRPPISNRFYVTLLGRCGVGHGCGTACGTGIGL